MTTGSAMDFFSKLTRPITQILLAVGATALALMMFLMGTDVILRYVFDSPLPGAYELVEYLLAIFIPFGIVYCAHERGHVTVDLVVDTFSRRIQAVFDSITTGMALILTLLLTWQNVLFIKETFDSKLESGVLYIPAYPFVAAVAVGFAALNLVLLVELLKSVSEAVKA